MGTDLTTKGDAMNSTSTKIPVATIRENDESDGELITFYAVDGEYDGEWGLVLEASNGDECGHYLPTTLERIKQDLRFAYLGSWESFNEI